MPRSLSLLEPPIDVALLTSAAAKSISLTKLINDTVGPIPNYRLEYLLQKAFEMVAELKNMGTLSLSIREKKDAEALQNLRARQDNVIESLTIELKQLTQRETGRQLGSLGGTREGQVTRLQ
ncbi:hypothetical protein BU26DRAFT_524792 [Trematosphaeria pertusa]|uniref:Uncharacterized protein n=1 Tax=Trematosphaeria pertusa TaxID=390896 RepID=A0A6A6HVE5_9PLEO|nr:uncharacterized protein BU26DRAFT_524792 [Trematosphaeria pertusa]KAF2242164.1 hypothetical protein BU26DRAFT_524792 [Trematosphaeria pertusa]